MAGIAAALDAIDVPALRGLERRTTRRSAPALGATGLLERFEGRIFSATDVEHGKPAPDLFLHAAARDAAPTPARCVVVEDAPPGAEAGRRAGMDVLGYAGLTAPELLAAEGARVFRSMAELPALRQRFRSQMSRRPVSVSRSSTSSISSQ